MKDKNPQPARRSIRGRIAQIAKDEAGDTSKIDYVSHPLDKAPAGPDATVKDETTTKKKPTTSTPARARTQRKSAAPHNKPTTKSAVRKRSTGNAALTGRSRSPVKKKKARNNSLAGITATSQDDIDHTHTQPSEEEIQQLAHTDSDLSELGRTPELPEFIDQHREYPKTGPGIDDAIEQLITEGLQMDQTVESPVLTTGSVGGAQRELTPIASVDHAPKTPTSQPVMNADQSVLITPQAQPTAPETGHLTTPASPGSLRQSQRSKNQPTRFGELVPTPAGLDDDTISIDQNSKLASANDIPTDQKASRNSRVILKLGNVTKSTRRKAPVSFEKLSSDDLADDVPATTKAPRKRKSEVSTTTPRKKAMKKESSPTKAPATTRLPRKTPVPRRKKEPAVTALPKTEATRTPAHLQSQADYLEASGLGFDPDLLKLSRALTHREPLGTKPEPRGKPEVWAPGRQELCETVPYYKSAHSGCYSRENNVYAFMFDSSGMGREYMDQDVIIARMGGGMDTDPKTGLMAQAKDHDIDAGQPRALLNNIVHRNPLAIICGNKNSGAPTSMPHRYCVLDWFKPTHIWAEMTMGKKGPTPTIRYRFERLDTLKSSWYAPASGSTPEAPSDLVLPSKTCEECLETCPQVYLIGWVCTNPKCVAMWKLSNGQNAPYGELDYHPAFLLHRTKWEREDPPFSLNPGVPEFGQHIGDNLTYINTRGVVCPKCGRCNPRYKFTHWQCDTAGCDWRLVPDHHIVTSSSLTHHPWDMTSDGPTLVKSQTAPVIMTQVRYRSNYKLLRYTIDGVAGSVIVAKANKKVASEPGGPDDMFREMQSTDLGLERRMLRASNDGEPEPPAQQHIVTIEPTSDIPGMVKVEQLQGADENDKVDDEPEDDHKAEVGNRMTAFGMNYGMPYKFIASGDSRSFEDAPTAIRAARSRLNFAQREFVNEPAGYQDFNEELVFGYMEGQIIKYHDDGEKGLGPRIATLSLGAGATMSLRVKAKYHSQVSNTGVFTFEKPLPLPVLESSIQGFKPKPKSNDPLKACKETHAARVAAFEELQELKNSGNMSDFRKRSKEIPKELKLKRGLAQPLLSFHLAHGDIVLMEGEDIQKFLEHQVEPSGNLRFALTCRTILANHLTPDQLPKYEVREAEVYDGSGVREEGDGEPLVWD